MKKLTIFLCVLIVLFASAVFLNAAVIYVDSGASGANNGSSWTNAYTDLQDALSTAVSGDDIWVTTGTYKPTAGAERTISFEMKDGVGIYGGFAGGETSLDERDWETNTTTLSGDLGTGLVKDDNSYNVTTCGIVTSSAVLDGFTITQGTGDGTTPYDRGSGIYIAGGSPTVANCIFSDNNGDFGGGMCINSGNPTVTNCTFSNNGGNFGGGIYINDANPIVGNCTFNNNNGSEGGGGGVYNDNGSLTMTNCTFSENVTPGFEGGGVHNDGGSLNVINCTFSSNSVGIYNNSYASLSIKNTLLADNYTFDLYNYGTITSSYNIVENHSGFSPGATDITGNQATLNLGALADNGGPTKTCALLAGSVAINAGTASGAPGTDQRGEARSGLRDIGAYEFLQYGIIYVDLGASGMNNGSTWTDAYTDLQDALDTAVSGEDIWVLANTYTPTGMASTSFELKDGVGIYGGFSGGETERNQRDWEINTTILSGNFYYYHVVACGNVSDSAVLDGFTITGGWADVYGGGFYNNGGDPTVANCIFSNNFAAFGGGMYNNQGDPTVTDCTFSDNEGGNHGGGMYNSYSSPTVTNCTFSSNEANSDGGGMYNDMYCSPTVINCTFGGNSAFNNGGGMYNYSSFPTVINCTFSRNSAVGNGDGIHNLYQLLIKNTILADNGTEDLYNDGIVTSSHNIVETSTGFTPDGTDITGNQPSLNLGALGDNGGTTLTRALLEGSVAINAGTSSDAPGTDQRGEMRDATPDIGAYEFPLAAPTVFTTIVSLITHDSASSGGEVTAEGGANLIARGVCWSTDPNPVVTGSHTIDGSGTGVFVSSITELIPNTTYYYRSYATNASWTSYGDGYSFTTGEAPLPVELTAFYAEIVSNGIELHWKTASEMDNAGFYVYRATGETPPFQKMASLISGAGTTSESHNYTFTDTNVQNSTLYRYKLSDINSETGRETFHPEIAVIAGQGMIDSDNLLPIKYALKQNHPNPFNPETVIEFEVPGRAYSNTPLQLRIYDSSGKLIKKLIDKEVEVGYHSIIWDGKDDHGKSVNSGVYFYKMMTEGYSQTRRCILLK